LFKAGGCDTPGFEVFGVIFGYFLLVLIIVSGFVLVLGFFFVVFDTPVDASVFSVFVVGLWGGFAFWLGLV